MKKRNLAIVIVLLVSLLVSIGGLTACTTDTETPPQNTEKPSQTKAPEKTEEPPAEPVELSLFSAYGIGNLQEEWYESDPLGRKIEEMSGVKMNYEFPTVTSGDAHDKLSLLLGAGTYPDIIHMDKQDLVKKVIDEKIAISLDELVDQHGPAIKDAYGDILDRIKWDDGKLYFLTTNYGNPSEGENVLPGATGYTFNFRQDLWKELGSPELKTLDDIYDFLVELGEKYPENTDGQNAYPLGGFVQGWQNTMDTLIASAGGYHARYYVDDSGQLSYWVRAPWAKDIISFYNRVHREEIIDPEAFTMDMATWRKEKLGVEKMYAYFGNGWMGRGAEPTYAEKGKEDALMDSIPFSVVTGQTPRVVEENPLGGKRLIVTDNCENPEAAVRWMNTLAELNFEVANGVEGGIWEMKDGKPQLLDEVVKKYQTGSVLDEEWALDTGFAMYKFMAKTQGASEWGTGMILKDDPYALNNTRVIERQEKLIGLTYDVVPFNALNNGINDDLSQILALIDTRMQTELYSAILADTEADSAQEFEKFINDLDSLGLEQLEEFWNDNYQAVK